MSQCRLGMGGGIDGGCKVGDVPCPVGEVEGGETEHAAGVGGAGGGAVVEEGPCSLFVGGGICCIIIFLA